MAALAFAFGGSAAWRIQHIGQILSLAWFAIALFLLLRAIDRRSIVWGALAGLTAGLMIVGRDQVAWLCTWILVLVVAWRVLEGGWRWAHVRAYVPALGAGAIVGVLTVALPIALTLALAGQSNRAAIDFEGAAGGSLHPGALYTFVSANLFGTDGPMKAYWGPPNPDFWGDARLALARNMANVYMGALPFVALLTLGVLRGGFLAKEIRVYTIAALVMLLFALGKYTPFFTLAFHAPAPTFSAGLPTRRSRSGRCWRSSRVISCIASPTATGAAADAPRHRGRRRAAGVRSLRPRRVGEGQTRRRAAGSGLHVPAGSRARSRCSGRCRACRVTARWRTRWRSHWSARSSSSICASTTVPTNPPRCRRPCMTRCARTRAIPCSR